MLGASRRAVNVSRLLVAVTRRHAASATQQMSQAGREGQERGRRFTAFGRNSNRNKAGMDKRQELGHNKDINEFLEPAVEEVQRAKRKLEFVSIFDVVNFLEMNNISNLEILSAIRVLSRERKNDIKNLSDRQLSVLLKAYGFRASTVMKKNRNLALSDFLKALRENNVKFGVLSMNAILEAKIDNDIEINAAAELQRYEEAGVTPDETTYGLLSSIYARQANSKAILEVMEYMKENDMKIGEVVVGSLVHAVAKNGYYGQADDIIKKFTPQLYEVELRYQLAYAALINGDIQRAVSAFKDTSHGGNLFGKSQQRDVAKLFVKMLEKGVTNAFELLSPYIKTTGNGQTMPLELSGQLAADMRVAAAEGRIGDALSIYERIEESGRKSNHVFILRDCIDHVIQLDSTPPAQMVDFAKQLVDKSIFQHALTYLLEGVVNTGSTERVIAVFDELKKKDYFYDILASSQHIRKPLAQIIARTLPMASSQTDHDRRIADVCTVLLVDKDEMDVMEDYRNIIFGLCNNDVTIPQRVLPLIEDYLVAKHFASLIIRRFLQNSLKGSDKDELALDKLEKFLDSNTIDDVFGQAIMGPLSQFLQQHSDSSVVEEKRRIAIGAKVIALSFPMDDKFSNWNSALIVDYIYNTVTIPISSIAALTELLQNEPRVNLTLASLNRIKEKMKEAKLLSERGDYVDALKKESKTISRWRRLSPEELEAELMDALEPREKKSPPLPAYIVALMRELLIRSSSAKDFELPMAIRILEGVSKQTAMLKEKANPEEKANIETLLRGRLRAPLLHLGDMAFDRALAQGRQEDIEKIWNMKVGLSVENMLVYICRLYLDGRVEEANAVGTVLRETGQSIAANTFETVSHRLTNVDSSKIGNLITYLCDTFGFQEKIVRRLGNHVAQNEIASLIAKGHIEEAFELASKLAKNTKKAVGQFELMNHALKTEDTALLHKTLNLVSEVNGQTTAIYDMIYCILDCGLAYKWTDKIKGLIERQQHTINSNMWGFFTAKAISSKRSDILLEMFRLLREKVSLIDVNNLLLTLTKIYYRENDFESLKNLKAEILAANHPMHPSLARYFKQLDEKTDAASSQTDA